MPSVKKFEKGCKAARTDLRSGTFDASASTKPPKSAFLDHINSVRLNSATPKLVGLRADGAAEIFKPNAARPKEADNDSLGGAENYHIYRDSTGFDYDVTLMRIDLVNNRNERYELRVRTISPF